MGTGTKRQGGKKAKVGVDEGGKERRLKAMTLLLAWEEPRHTNFVDEKSD